MKKLDVVSFGVGVIGSLTAKFILEEKRDRMDLTGAYDVDPRKVGKDLGKVIGLDRSVGIKISDDLDGVLTGDVDAAIHTTSSFLKGAYPQLESIVSHGVDWLDDPHLALWTILIANIWLGVPFFTLLLYSALQDVPAEIKEAAIIDGASPWQRLRLVVVPIILPVIEVTLLLGFVFTVKVFDLVIGLTGGGPANATQLITTWSYNLSFQQFSFGYGAALNNVLLVLALVCAPIYLFLSRDSLRRSSGADR